MSTVDPRFISDMLDAASRNIRSRQNRERKDFTPKKCASWLMNVVLDLQQADEWKESQSKKELR
jgi:hypothetical protein